MFYYWLSIVIIIHGFVNIFFASCDKLEAEVVTESGILRGTYMMSRGGRTINAFLGIPFAKPPVEDLRFMPPIPIDPWKGTFNATKVHVSCPQRDIYRRSNVFEGDEDCLYLNVYSPKLASEEGKPFPVMVFFHGGGWLCGGGNSLWYGPDVLLDRDIVLVVTNYRLGALGFFSTGDGVVPGNNGLKDQHLVLKWVQKNVKAFGGDAGNVTIFGESAGGASVHYHMLSPMSRDLFHRGIAQSGTSQCVWALAPKNESIHNSKKLANAFGCPTNSSSEMVKCLRRIDSMEIVKKDVVFMEWDFDPMIPFKPTIEPKLDGAFLTEDPIDIIKTGRSAQIPLIVGITTHDGALRGAGLLGNPHLLMELNKDFERLVPVSLMYDKTASDVDLVTREIRKYYFKNQKVNSTKSRELIDLYTDGWFLNCADETVRLHLKYSKHPVYYYLFGHRGVSSFTQIFGGGETDYGVCHADDLQYLFPVGDDLFPDKEPSQDDLHVAQLFTSLWVDFARTGNPTPDTPNGLAPEKWHPVKSDNMEYYYIGANSTSMKTGLFLDRANFWRSLEYKLRSDLYVNEKDEL